MKIIHQGNTRKPGTNHGCTPSQSIAADVHVLDIHDPAQDLIQKIKELGQISNILGDLSSLTTVDEIRNRVIEMYRSLPPGYPLISQDADPEAIITYLEGIKNSHDSAVAGCMKRMIVILKNAANAFIECRNAATSACQATRQQYVAVDNMAKFGCQAMIMAPVAGITALFFTGIYALATDPETPDAFVEAFPVAFPIALLSCMAISKFCLGDMWDTKR